MPIKTPPQPPAGYLEMTEEEYLLREPASEYKSEFRQGRVYAMSGASFNHNLLAMNLAGEIHQQLKGKPCNVLNSDMRTKVKAAHLYTYPDAIVVCGRPDFDAKDKHALINPTVIIEVLSPSTEAYDRGEKFGYYQKLDSLREYVLVSQNQVGVERFMRMGTGEWIRTHYRTPSGTLELPSIQCRVFLNDIYAKVDFKNSEPHG